MVATYEENIAKLKDQENWWTFTDPQREFLNGMAKGMKPLDAIKHAYPDSKNAVTLTKHMLSRVGIQKALATIGIDCTKANVTKDEALQMLSTQLRKASDPELIIKLLGIYSKLSGWGAKEEVAPPDEEVDLNKLVSAIERRRRNNGEQPS